MIGRVRVFIQYKIHIHIHLEKFIATAKTFARNRCTLVVWFKNHVSECIGLACICFTSITPILYQLQPHSQCNKLSSIWSTFFAQRWITTTMYKKNPHLTFVRQMVWIYVHLTMKIAFTTFTFHKIVDCACILIPICASLDENQYLFPESLNYKNTFIEASFQLALIQNAFNS